MTFQEAKRNFVRNYLSRVLEASKGRTTEAAKLSGMSVPNFCKLLRTNGMKAEEFR